MTIDDTLTQEQATKFALDAIYQLPESYYERNSQGVFEPHPWVILAIQDAFRAGFYHSI